MLNGNQQHLLSLLNQLNSHTVKRGEVAYVDNRFLEELTSLFKDFVHIIDPDLSSINSPVDTFSIEGAINYVKIIETMIKKDGGSLKKPIVAIWNTSKMCHKSETSERVYLDHWHWQACVILPISYVKPDGTKLDNKEEIVYFRDSYHQNAKLPFLLKYLLRNDIKQEAKAKSKDKTILGGKLKHAKFFEICQHREQSVCEIEEFVEQKDCIRMAMHDAFMFVIHGTDQWIGMLKPNWRQERQLTNIVSKIENQPKCQENCVGINQNELKMLSSQLSQLISSQIQTKQLVQQQLDLISKFELYYQCAFLQIYEELQNNQVAISQVSRMRDHDLWLQNNPKMLKVQLGLTFPNDGEFIDLVQKDIFIDKSIFIKEIIDSDDYAILISRPKQWGKTLNLQMVRDFFQPDVDSQGNFNLGKGNKNYNLFSKLIIASQKTEVEELKIIEKFQGQHPVIFLSLKEARADTYEGFITKLKSEVSQLYMQHDYVYRKQLITRLEDHEIKVEDKENVTIQKLETIVLLNKIDLTQDTQIFKSFRNQESKPVDFLSSLTFLCDRLFEYFNRKVYILLDDYDIPVMHFWYKSLEDQYRYNGFLKPAIDFITQFLSSCGKGNNKREKMIMSGVTDIFFRKEQSLFDNVACFSLLGDQSISAFGFTANEINAQISKIMGTAQHQELKNFNMDRKAGDLMLIMKKWYSGYKINGDVTLYIPGEVMKYLRKLYKDCKKGLLIPDPKSYWVDTGVINIFESVVKVQLSDAFLGKIQQIVSEKKNQLECTKDFSSLRDSLLGKPSDKLIVNLLICSGYLKKCKTNGYKLANKSVPVKFKERVLARWLSQVWHLGVGFKQQFHEEIDYGIKFQKDDDSSDDDSNRGQRNEGQRKILYSKEEKQGK